MIHKEIYFSLHPHAYKDSDSMGEPLLQSGIAESGLLETRFFVQMRNWTRDPPNQNKVGYPLSLRFTILRGNTRIDMLNEDPWVLEGTYDTLSWKVMTSLLSDTRNP